MCIKLNTGSSWKNEIRHHIIFLSCKPVELRKSKLLIQCDYLKFCVRQLHWINDDDDDDAWKGPLF